MRLACVVKSIVHGLKPGDLLYQSRSCLVRILLAFLIVYEIIHSS